MRHDTDHPTVWLIDGLRFSRDCFAIAATDLCVVPIGSVKECLELEQADVRLILYHPHDADVFDNVTLRHVTAMQQKFGDIPIMVLSDAADEVRQSFIRRVLNSGARGFIPTRTTDMTAALTAIRFVMDGGTFAPLDDLLLPSKPARVAQQAAGRLTPRQQSVLRCLKLGMPNKIIAFQLGTSESTVKVHVRNIMRKMGAANRTEAIYNFECLDQPPEMPFARLAIQRHHGWQVGGEVQQR